MHACNNSLRNILTMKFATTPSISIQNNFVSVTELNVFDKILR